MPSLSFDNNSSISEVKSFRKKIDDDEEDNYEVDNFEEDETSTAVSSPHQSRRLNSERNMRTSSVKSSQASLRSAKSSFEKIGTKLLAE